MRATERALALVRRLAGQTAQERLERRASKLATDHLVDWAEATVPAIGRALSDWGREGRPESLGEASLGAASLLVVLEELERRQVRPTAPAARG